MSYTEYEMKIANLEDELALKDKEIEKLKDGLKKCLPVVTDAFHDNSSAGYISGSGYRHSCYGKLPFRWNEVKKFDAWVGGLKGIIYESS